MILLRFLILTLLIIFAGCAMPRIMIYDDPLSSEEHLKLGIAYEKDEEFDGTLRVLFDRSASRYLKTDIIKTLIVYMVKKLIS